MLRNHATALFATLLLTAACGGGTYATGQGSGSQYATGKADAYGTCETGRALDFVNAASTTDETLQNLGARSRARKNILAHRNGPDGVLGSSDDDLFDSLAELDAIPYVGPVTLDAIVAHALETGAPCVASSTGTVEVVFSPQPWHLSHLARVVERIEAADQTIDVAMYSLSDGTVFQALEDAARRGVSIRLLYEGASEDRKGPAGTRSARLEDAGIDVRWINKIMHHKFAIFDGPRRDPAKASTAKVVSGSGNWSYSAGTKYDENTLFIDGNTELTLRLQAEFDHLWNNSRDLAWNTSLETEFGAAVDAEAIAAADTPAVDAAFTSANFRTSISSRYGATFSVNRGENEIADRLVALIEGAQRQILIASGHLRSRPVAEALIAKHKADPSVEIRVLLDNQEYLSVSTHENQVRDLEACLAGATTDTQTAACLDRGFLFGYQVHAEGIDVRFKAYAYRWHYSYAVQMHHKFMVVDGQTLVTGSYNLSDNAEHNTMENMLFFDVRTYPELVEAYVLNFEQIWNLGRSEGLFASRMDEIENGTGSRIDIVFEPMTLDWQQVTDLKGALRDHCSDINDTDFRAHPENHRTCTRN
ncbi:MAG: phospholipase D-like domain-containing protein [Deltaproteobacteria bacterium]|nr:phospholipase D-like domain-containing protein [Deltaproteobacteria bacterium]